MTITHITGHLVQLEQGILRIIYIGQRLEDFVEIGIVLLLILCHKYILLYTPGTVIRIRMCTFLHFILLYVFLRRLVYETRVHPPLNQLLFLIPLSLLPFILLNLLKPEFILGEDPIDFVIKLFELVQVFLHHVFRLFLNQIRFHPLVNQFRDILIWLLKFLFLLRFVIVL